MPVYLILYLLNDCILHGAGHEDGALEPLLHARASAEQHKQVGLKLGAAVTSLVKGHGWGK